MNVIAMALIVVDAKYGNPLAFRAVLSPPQNLSSA
jgi:hypothetical protein